MAPLRVPDLSTYAYHGRGVDSSQYQDFRQNDVLKASNDVDLIQTHQQLSHSTQKSHTWSKEERMVLLVMLRYLKVSRRDQPKLMNEYFKTTAIPFAINMLEAQYADMRNPSKKTHPIWKFIFKETSFKQPSAAVSTILTRLQKCAKKAKVLCQRRSIEKTLRQQIQTTTSSTSRTMSSSEILDSSLTIQHRSVSVTSITSTQTDFLPVQVSRSQSTKERIVSDQEWDVLEEASSETEDKPEIVDLDDESKKSSYVIIDDDDLEAPSSERPHPTNRQMSPLDFLSDIGDFLPDSQSPSKLKAKKVTSRGQSKNSASTQEINPKTNTLTSDKSLMSTTTTMSQITRYHPLETSSQHTDGPSASILFRMWSSESAGKNSPQGFRAVDYNYQNESLQARRILPPPEINNPYILDRLAGHYAHERTGSPVISTSNFLLRAFRKAFVKLRDNRDLLNDIHVTVIDPTVLIQQKAVYHGAQVHKLLRDNSAIPKEYDYYKRSQDEFLVWGEIPQASIHTTFKLSTFLDLKRNPSAAKFLRLDVLQSYSLPTVSKKFRAQPVCLDNTTYLGLVDILFFFKVTPLCLPSLITSMLQVLISNWVIDIKTSQDVEAIFELWIFKHYQLHGAESSFNTEVVRKAFHSGIEIGHHAWTRFSKKSSHVNTISQEEEEFEGFDI